MSSAVADERTLSIDKRALDMTETQEGLAFDVEPEGLSASCSRTSTSPDVHCKQWPGGWGCIHSTMTLGTAIAPHDILDIFLH